MKSRPWLNSRYLRDRRLLGVWDNALAAAVLLLLVGFPAWRVRPAAEAALERVVLVFFDCASALPAADFALLLARVHRSVRDAAFAAFLDVFLLTKLNIRSVFLAVKEATGTSQHSHFFPDAYLENAIRPS